jgi:hypothetical protein
MEQDKRKPTPKLTIENEIDPEDWKNHTVNRIEELDNEQIGNAVLLSYIEKAKSEVWINVKTGIAMELAIKENKKKADLLVEKLIPEDLHNFLDVFDDNKANRFPESNVWDHKNDMKEGFEPKSFKNYNLTPEEQEELANSWTKIWKKNIFDHPSRPKRHLSSLSKRRMEDFDHVKIIGT